MPHSWSGNQEQLKKTDLLSIKWSSKHTCGEHKLHVVLDDDDPFVKQATSFRLKIRTFHELGESAAALGSEALCAGQHIPCETQVSTVRCLHEYLYALCSTSAGLNYLSAELSRLLYFSVYLWLALHMWVSFICESLNSREKHLVDFRSMKCCAHPSSERPNERLGWLETLHQYRNWSWTWKQMYGFGRTCISKHKVWGHGIPENITCAMVTVFLVICMHEQVLMWQWNYTWSCLVCLMTEQDHSFINILIFTHEQFQMSAG